MALPETNLTIDAIQDVLGYYPNDVGLVRISSNNNWWGFSSAIRGWSQTNPQPPYDIGDYRGYDHYWRCWAMEVIGNLSVDYENDSVFEVNLFNFPAWAHAESTSHTFAVFWKRTDDYQHDDGYQLGNTVTLNGATSFQKSFNNSVPPDGGAALEEGATVYIMVRHISSDARRWDDNNSIWPPDRNSDYVYPFVVPRKSTSPPFINISAAAAQGWANPSKQISALIDISANAAGIIVNWEFEFTEIENDWTKSTMITGSVQSADGTIRDSDTIVAPITYTVGKTIYYRARITSVSGANDYNGSYWSGNYVVQNGVPI